MIRVKSLRLFTFYVFIFNLLTACSHFEYVKLSHTDNLKAARIYSGLDNIAADSEINVCSNRVANKRQACRTQVYEMTNDITKN